MLFENKEKCKCINNDCIALNLSDETSTVKTPTKLTVTLRYFRQTNAIYFDNIQLIKEPVPSYTYDDDGMRMSKTVNGTKYTYQYLGGMLLQETRGNAVIDYSYDASGTLYALRYKANATDAGTYYYYARNWRADIIGLYDSNKLL